MSESSIELSVKFSEAESAEKVENLLNNCKKGIFAPANANNELYLHDYLNYENQTMGIDFDSLWVPEKVDRNDDILLLKLIGSPSGTKEQDIITWLKLFGAMEITGEMIVDGGGDVDVVKIGQDEEINDDELDIEYKDGAGHSQLHLSAEAGNAEMVKRLINKGANIEAQNKSGRTPMFMAINDDITTEEAIKCLDILLKAGANIDSLDGLGSTPLFLAVLEGNKNIVLFLIDNGANYSNSRDFEIEKNETSLFGGKPGSGSSKIEKETVLDYAVRCWEADIVEILKTHKAKSLRNKELNIDLQVAIQISELWKSDEVGYNPIKAARLLNEMEVPTFDGEDSWTWNKVSKAISLLDK